MAPSPDPLQQPGSSASQRAKRNRSEFQTCIGSKGPAATLSLQKGDLQPVLEDKFLPAWKPSLCLVSLWVMKLWMRAFAVSGSRPGASCRDKVNIIACQSSRAVYVLWFFKVLWRGSHLWNSWALTTIAPTRSGCSSHMGIPKQMPQIARP